jgi:GT2 family glycosyltransferase
VDLQTPGAAAPEPAVAAAPVAPAVVAVVVAHDPGPWFEEVLESLTGQDYPNLAVLVVDAGSASPVKPRVAAVAPRAFVRRLEDNPGFGAAANEVLEVVDGAAFYLLCHDDVALSPDAVRLLVEEAFRSNAGVVGPKLVDWHEPRRLLQVGEGMDQVGYSLPLVERGELDQEQHDSVRDVFTVPGACTLVRADLFASVGGYDESIDYHVDDLSLCWRAHVAGARVVVAPAARVRHLEALAVRRTVDDRRRLQTRHRLRVVLSTYSLPSLALALPRLVVLHVLEAVYALLVGRRGQARDIVSGWWWNLRRAGGLRAARAQVRSFRHVRDREVRALMAPGSARLRQFTRGQIGHGDDRLRGLARTSRGMAGTFRAGSLQLVLLVWGVVALVLLAGSRHLITRGVPVIGELVPFSSSPVDLARSWLTGWRHAGLGSESPAPTAFGLLSGAGFVSGGAMGLLRTLLTVGLVPLGAWTAYRLPAATGSRHAQVAALLVYVANPLPYNALANGRWGALALYAAVPSMVAMLARASQLAPFGPRAGTLGVVRGSSRARHQVLGLGLLTALVAALVPVAVPLVVVLAGSLALGSLIALHTAGSGRMLVVAAAAAVVAVALHLPWSLDLLVPGTPLSALTGAETARGTATLADLLRFEMGPLGAAPLGWIVLVPAVLPILIARGERHAWAVRGWTMAVVFWGLAWAAERGDVPFALPAVDVLLAPAAAGLALATAMGVVAFQVDLPGYRFGWRQLAAGLAAASLAVTIVPVLGAAFDGSWSMPRGDHSRALRFIDAENDESPFRVLWLGDPAVLPLGSWELEAGLAYATTDRGTPRTEDLWAGSDDGRTRLLADAVDLARSGQTARLGRLLAPMGIRYVVVPERLAPAPFADDEQPIPAGLAGTLDAQLDLEPLDLPAGLRVYANQAAAPLRATTSDPSLVPEGGGIADAVDRDLSTMSPALVDEVGASAWAGEVADESVVYAAVAHSERWRLTVDGLSAEPSKPFGWATAFAVGEGGDARLEFDTSPLRYLLLLVQAVAWALVLRTVVRARVNAEPVEVPT